MKLQYTIWLLSIAFEYLAVGPFARAEANRLCTVKDDLKYMYGRCDPVTRLANVHFYYDKDDKCAPPRRETIGQVDESTPWRQSGSDPIPPYLPNVQCDHYCNKDGFYSHIQFSP